MPIALTNGPFGPSFGPCPIPGCGEQALVGLMCVTITPQGHPVDAETTTCLQHLPIVIEEMQAGIAEQSGTLRVQLPATGAPPDPDSHEPLYAVVHVDDADPWAALIVSTHDSYSAAVLSCDPKQGQQVGAYAWAVALVTDARMMGELSDRADHDPSLHGPREILTGPLRETRVTVAGEEVLA